MSFSSGSGGNSGPYIYVQGYPVPTEFWNMLNTASVDQGVQIPVLVMIWRFEASGKYPNPTPPNYAGFGGLFGLGNNQFYQGIGPIHTDDGSQASNLMQCEAAASEVHTLVTQKGGDLYAAMLSYDGGAVAEAQAVAEAAGGTTGIGPAPVPPVETVAAVQAQQNVPSSIPPKSSLAFDGFRVAFANIIPSIVSDYNAIRTTWNHGGGGVPGGAPNR